MKNIIKDLILDEERALYNLKDTEVVNVKFSGEADGESALKEIRNCDILDSYFNLRYPLWHAQGFNVQNSEFTPLSRAPIWYANNGFIKNTKIYGTKSVRECHNLILEDCDINSDEFGWKCNYIKLNDSNIESSYLFFGSNNISVDNIEMKGKYSFQYINNLKITNSELRTKDAFWHSENVYIKDSVIYGEYLGWFSKNLTLENCVISSTQPLCYCENLKIINCYMDACDLAFEYSTVDATILGDIESIKNPKAGTIICDSVEEIILDDSIYESKAKIIERDKQDEKLA